MRNRITITLLTFGLLATLSGAWVAPPIASGALAIPETPAGSQLIWALDQVNSGARGTTERRVAGHFSDDYLAVVAPIQLIGYFRDYLFPAAPLEVMRFEGGVTEYRSNAILRGPFGYWRVELGVEPADPHRINALWFEPVVATSAISGGARSWSALKAQVRPLAPRVSFTVAEVTSGSCEPIARVDPDNVLPIASSFKLYVLGELARQVAEGDAAWNELLPISPNYISLPNGEMRLEPVGAEFPLVHFAEQMISKSDNTATDHLIGRLGRKNVEAAFAWMGQGDPTINVPLMLTREWFAIRMRFSQKGIDRYYFGDETERRELIKTEASPAADTLTEGEPWPGSAFANEIEWFASSSDLCKAFAYLVEAGQKPGFEPVLNALSLEPEIIFDPEVWAYVGYKGGYETGVMSENFLLQRHDGPWFVISGLIMDPNYEINGPGLRDVIIQATNMLATSG